MNFGFDFPQSNPCLFRPGQFIDLTSPVENTTYSQKYANNMACGETSAHGRENLGPHNQSVQFFQSQTSSNEQRTQKSEKKNKRKKNAAIRRAVCLISLLSIIQVTLCLDRKKRYSEKAAGNGS